MSNRQQALLRTQNRQNDNKSSNLAAMIVRHLKLLNRERSYPCYFRSFSYSFIVGKLNFLESILGFPKLVVTVSLVGSVPEFKSWGHDFDYHQRFWVFAIARLFVIHYIGFLTKEKKRVRLITEKSIFEIKVTEMYTLIIRYEYKIKLSFLYSIAIHCMNNGVQPNKSSKNIK